MADIEASRLGVHEFRVQVRDGERATTQQMTVPERLRDELELHHDEPERVVREYA